MHTVLFTANGVPLIYSGGEVGEETNRGLIDWSDPDVIKPYFKSLVKIRNKYLANPTLSRITNSYPEKTYTYTSQSDSNLLLTHVNFSSLDVTQNVYIERNQLPNDGVSTYYLTNLFNGNVKTIAQTETTISLDTLSGYEAVIYYFGTKPQTVDVKNDDNLIISDYSLSQNYPNPFNPSTKIKYSIPSTQTPLLGGAGGGFVTLKIYDILGREVATLVNKQQKAGNYKVNFNASQLTSGIYFYRLQSGNFNENKKMILLK